MSAPRVAVTGITGFLGSHVTALLLRRGYTVHGTVRSRATARLEHLPTDAPGALELFEADLHEPESYAAALAGCEFAVHMAYPVRAAFGPDAKRELMDAGVAGTTGFLRACVAAGVRKVVLTSTFATVSVLGESGKVFTEDDWNDVSTLDFMAYKYSKTEAERQALALAHETGLHLVVLNPPQIFGPSLTAIKSIPVAAGLEAMAKGNTPYIMDIELRIADVRDVAEAHLKALESDAAKGRYICCPKNPMIHVRDFARILREMGFHAPTLDLSHPVMSAVFRVISPVYPGGGKGDAVRTLVGNPIYVDASKIERDLGVQFRTPEETVRDTVADLYKWGHIKKVSETS